MGRPFSNIEQISLGFEMYARGYQRHRIMDAFSEQARPSLRTLGNWTARYKKISDSDLALEDQFEWPHMDLFSIPWKYSDLISRLRSFANRNPSIRRVIWWFRIKHTYPSYSDTMVSAIADKCIINEHMDLLGIPGSDWSISLDASYLPEKDQLELLPGTFAVCSFGLSTILPDWVQNGVFLSIVRTATEISVVCSDELIPQTEEISRGWFCLRFVGENISWEGIISRIIAVDQDYIFSVSNINYLLSKDLELFERLGIALIEKRY